MATPLRLACISGGYPVWALEAGLAQGLFVQHGLALEVTATGSSTVQLAGLREGRFDIGLQLADHVVRATAEGCPMVVLAAQSHAPDVALMAAPGVASLEALKGQPIGVDGARSGYALLLRRLLLSRGFGPADVMLAEVGGTQERADALRQGRVQAAFVNPPLDRGLAQAGFIRLTGTREAFPDYPGPVAACRREWAQAHPDVASAFQAAWAASWAWLLDPAHAEAAVALAAQRFDVPQVAATAVLERLRTQGLPGIDAGGLGVVSELVGEDLAAREAVPDPASLLWPCGA